MCQTGVAWKGLSLYDHQLQLIKLAKAISIYFSLLVQLWHYHVICLLPDPLTFDLQGGDGMWLDISWIGGIGEQTKDWYKRDNTSAQVS